MIEMHIEFGEAAMPFGGSKQTGKGRECGAGGLEEHLAEMAFSDWE